MLDCDGNQNYIINLVYFHSGELIKLISQGIAKLTSVLYLERIIFNSITLLFQGERLELAARN
jgi:hypothetical protein